METNLFFEINWEKSKIIQLFIDHATKTAYLLTENESQLNCFDDNPYGDLEYVSTLILDGIRLMEVEELDPDFDENTMRQLIFDGKEAREKYINHLIHLLIKDENLFNETLKAIANNHLVYKLGSNSIRFEDFSFPKVLDVIIDAQLFLEERDDHFRPTGLYATYDMIKDKIIEDTFDEL